MVFHSNNGYMNASQCYVFMNVASLVNLDSGGKEVARLMRGCFTPVQEPLVHTECEAG